MKFTFFSLLSWRLFLCSPPSLYSKYLDSGSLFLFILPNSFRSRRLLVLPHSCFVAFAYEPILYYIRRARTVGVFVSPNNCLLDSFSSFTYILVFCIFSSQTKFQRIIKNVLTDRNRIVYRWI